MTTHGPEPHEHACACAVGDTTPRTSKCRVPAACLVFVEDRRTPFQRPLRAFISSVFAHQKVTTGEDPCEDTRVLDERKTRATSSSTMRKPVVGTGEEGTTASACETAKVSNGGLRRQAGVTALGTYKCNRSLSTASPDEIAGGAFCHESVVATHEITGGKSKRKLCSPQVKNWIF